MDDIEIQKVNDKLDYISTQLKYTYRILQILTAIIFGVAGYKVGQGIIDYFSITNWIFSSVIYLVFIYTFGFIVSKIKMDEPY